jgi:phosphopantetheine--protein transferase-like protein
LSDHDSRDEMTGGPGVRVGTDLVHLAEFARSLENGGPAMMRRLFHPSESAGATAERLAGIFAAKEAAFKALSLPKGDWHVLEIRHDDDGRPSVRLAPELARDDVLSLDVSISHAGDYAFATVAALVREPE